MRDRVRIILKEAVPKCGSYEVRFPDARTSQYFYWDGRHLRAANRTNCRLDPPELLRLDGNLVAGSANAQSCSRYALYVGVAIMVTSNEDADWKTAQAALEAASRLPAGAARIEALKHAGRLRFDADRKRMAKEPKPNNQGRHPKKNG